MAVKPWPCCTVATINSFEWTIPTFSRQLGFADKPLFSSVFTSGKNGDEQWRLELRFEGVRLNRIDSISVYMNLLNYKKDTPIAGRFEVAMVNPKKNTKMWRVGLDTEKVLQSLTDKIPVYRRVMPKRREVYLYDDTLTIRFDVKTIMTVDTVKEPNTSPSAFGVDPTEQDFSRGMKQFFNSPEYSDVIVQVGDRTFPAHKVVLISRSSVFAAMFSSHMSENRENRVKIDDLEPETVENMLYYMYTSEVPKDFPALNMLVAAEKYQLERLKSICEIELSRTLCPSNAAVTLYYADIYNAPGMKQYVLDYIIANETEVAKSDEFKALLDQNKKLASEVYQAHVIYLTRNLSLHSEKNTDDESGKKRREGRAKRQLRQMKAAKERRDRWFSITL
uniref:BTB domain-containing protein n=1 Tax=Bracon brevicornis TaxID=1563983 RepID=A0A6V7HYG1_9HYME